MWMYDRFSLSRLLQSTGFQSIRVVCPHESSIPAWADYELDVRDGIVCDPSSLFMEALKLIERIVTGFNAPPVALTSPAAERRGIQYKRLIEALRPLRFPDTPARSPLRARRFRDAAARQRWLRSPPGERGSTDLDPGPPAIVDVLKERAIVVPVKVCVGGFFGTCPVSIVVYHENAAD